MGWAGAEALTFMHGNVDATVAVFEKNVGIFEDIKTTKGYSDRDHSKVYQMELMYMMSGTPLACFLMGKNELGMKMMEAGKRNTTDSYDEYWEDMGDNVRATPSLCGA